jgi:DNA-binding response OmpR family regulator
MDAVKLPSNPAEEMARGPVKHENFPRMLSNEAPLRTLIVEDERALGMFLKKSMEREGHRVAWVGDGETALELIEAEAPDLLVLDLSLPRRDGMDVLKQMQGNMNGMAVLVLTGRSGVEERVTCLNLGADDCLLKPFSFHELVARCNALMRRRERQVNPMLRCGGLQVHRMTRAVQMEGRDVQLTTKEFALLEFLMLRRGECVSRGELLEKVWQMSPNAGTNVVDVYINYLRRKLAGPDQSDGLIETVRGSGYRIEPNPSAAREAKAKRGMLREMKSEINPNAVGEKKPVQRVQTDVDVRLMAAGITGA